MKFTYYGQCEKNKRETNMDSLYIKHKIIENKDVLMILVCDGVGSLTQGGLASSTATLMFKEWFEELTEIKQIGIKFLNQTQNINSHIKDTINIKQIKSATTLTACLVLDNITYCVHVGDSSLYVVNDNNINKITVDDVTESNKLSAYIGQLNQLYPQYYEIESEYDYIMLCSDGITKKISDSDIKKIIYNSKKAKNGVANLVETAVENNESDNITCAIVKKGK